MAHGQAVVLFFFAVLLHSRLALLGRGYGTAQGVRNQSGVPAAACHGALPRPKCPTPSVGSQRPGAPWGGIQEFNAVFVMIFVVYANK